MAQEGVLHCFLDIFEGPCVCKARHTLPWKGSFCIYANLRKFEGWELAESAGGKG